MVSRSTLEFVVGLTTAGVVSGALSLSMETAYALAIGLAAGTPALVRTSSRLDRESYDAAKSSTEQVVDGALAAVSTAVVGVAGGYVAVSNGYEGPVAIAVAAATGVFAGQILFYARNGDYIQ
ncbi:hypothetical protein [Halobacterium jilantaiense]|uniref:Uncharacterized protein n=1 Tax=Halobacterium jilantaiense TaxID=355548 RepID=A0A1I0QA09_9EURY|nr:hypothetical protein [Halobacterium jilantaiense]SEW23857.1 hypothetical protein SAMN04487945_2419 [Halobacterium jilantaiense]